MRYLTFVILISILSLGAHAEDVELKPNPSFSNAVIDVGIVVADVSKSLEFYTKALGFQYAGKFVAKAQVAADAGLSTTKDPITIHMLKLSNDKSATTVKLMEIPDSARRPVSTQTIHSQLGLSYLTLWVTDMTKSLATASKLGYKPLKKGPVDLGGGKLYLAVLKDPDGNFIEFVGPKTAE